MSLIVEELCDDSAIADFLASQRLWTAYGLCDLDPAYRRDARFLGAVLDGQIIATVLVYSPSGFIGLLPFGDQGGVDAILTMCRELPSHPFLLVGEEHLQAVGRQYRLSTPWSMYRMAVDAAKFSPSGSSERVVRLSVTDRAAMEDLYGTERNSAFLEDPTIEHGVYFGVFEGRSLVAVAGTHAWSRQHRIGAVGGVFTRPDRRGRGLARATTAAVTNALFELGVQDVVLNVRTDNTPARRCYDQLGFETVRSYLESQAVDRRPETTESSRRGPAAPPGRAAR